MKPEHNEPPGRNSMDGTFACVSSLASTNPSNQEHAPTPDPAQLIGKESQSQQSKIVRAKGLTQSMWNT